jgi:hypothetical protein
MRADNIACQQSSPDVRMAGCKEQDISKHAPYESLPRRPVADVLRNGRWRYTCTSMYCAQVV